MASGRQGDDPGIPGGELRDEEPGEFEVPEMVCPGLYFESVMRPLKGVNMMPALFIKT